MSDDKSDHKPVIIIKKKGGHGEGHHGGSWKVAIADFAIAMMALFLVLWLLSITDDEQKKVISSYFSPGRFSQDGTSYPINLGGSPTMSQRLENNPSAGGPGEGGKRGTDVVGDMKTAQRGERVEFKNLADELRNMLGSNSEQKKGGDVFVEVRPEGVRMVIMDDTNKPMFKKGGTRMTPYYEDLLINLGHVIRKSGNPVMISGHTDATPARTFHYDNWDLSGDRALIAQKLLRISGVPDEQILMVSALANHAPRVQDDPLDVSNRRIEIVVLELAVAKKIQRMFGTMARSEETREDPVPTSAADSASEDDLDKARQAAHTNQLPDVLIPE